MSGEGESEWNLPAHASSTQIEAAKKFVMEAESARPPSPRQFLVDHLSALLAHFFSAATGEKLNAIVAAHWINIIGPFPAHVVNSAIHRWLETKPHKPKPTEIRELCIHFYGWKDWQNYERARMLSGMMPSDIKPKSGGQEAPQEKPDEAKKAKVAEILHNNRLAHSKEFCPLCKAEAAAEVKP